MKNPLDTIKLPIPVRPIVYKPKNDDDLYEQPMYADAERELVESHNRCRFAAHFNYADPLAGNSHTYDKRGNYNCGRCNMADGNKCLLLKIKEIDRKAGSCGDWEVINAGDPEMDLHEKSPAAAVYGVAANGMGFGCHRCPYASQAKQTDSCGRTMYCGKGDFRVFPNACCSLNGAKTL